MLARPAGEFCWESPLSEYLPGRPFFSEFKPFEPVGTKSVAAVTLLKIGERLAAINLFYFKAGNLDRNPSVILIQPAFITFPGGTVFTAAFECRVVIGNISIQLFALPGFTPRLHQ